jgi:hypothetical protein
MPLIALISDGTAMPDTMPITTHTISMSMSVKPASRRFENWNNIVIGWGCKRTAKLSRSRPPKYAVKNA